jgi:hypothetical protein
VRTLIYYLFESGAYNGCRRWIIAELGGTTLMTADCEAKLLDWRHALLVKIGRFWELQKLYIPGVPHAIAAADSPRLRRCSSKRRENQAVHAKPTTCERGRGVC